MRRAARMFAALGAAVAALGLGMYVFAWGDPTTDKITVWVFFAGAALAVIGILGGASDREGGERP